MKKYILGIAAIVMVVAASAFTIVKNNKTTTKAVETTWYFVGENLDQANQAEAWQTENPELGCGSGIDLPCTMSVEDAPDQAALETFLSGKSDIAIRDTYSDTKRAE